MQVTFKHYDLFVTSWETNVLFSTKIHHVNSMQAKNGAQQKSQKNENRTKSQEIL
jgi:hypothetical protein